jgi:hypothetical protein
MLVRTFASEANKYAANFSYVRTCRSKGTVHLHWGQILINPASFKASQEYMIHIA